MSIKTTAAVTNRRRFFKGESVSDIVFDIVNFIIVCILTIIFLYPLIYVICCSFSGADAIWGGKVVLWPVDFTLDGYERCIAYPDIWTGYLNSLCYLVVGVSLVLMVTMLTAYPLARKDFMARNFFTLLLVIPMFFGGGLIPTYLLIKSFGWINQIWALVIPGALNTWNVVVMRTYYTSSIPNELWESAEIDGCSNLRYLVRIAIPLSVPIIAVLGLFAAVGSWNSYFSAMIYLTDRAKYPLQLILREILVTNNFAWGDTMDVGLYDDAQAKARVYATLKYAVIIVASVPVMLAYPFVQKYFVRGIMVGSLKA